MSEAIDTGDVIKHGPTGETWVVAYVDGDRIAWCGWPPGEAALSDCTLVTKATPQAQERLLRQMADMRPDERGDFDRRQRVAAARLQKEYGSG